MPPCLFRHSTAAAEPEAICTPVSCSAAVAANLCAAAVGTETDASIICPAQTNGIVGLKPTVGLVSRSGIIPIAHSQDTAGPMGRTVADVAALLGGLIGVDDEDEVTVSSEDHSYRDYTQFLDRGGLEGARIGVARRLFGTDKRVINIIESGLEKMKTLGAELIEVKMGATEKFEKSELEVLFYEYKVGLNTYLANRGRMTRVASLQDVIKFNEENRVRVLPYFGQEHMQVAQKKGSLTTKRYINALEKNHRLSQKDLLEL